MSTKTSRVLSYSVVSLAAIIWLVIKSFPLFFDSKVERVSEDDLPKISVENDSVVYCRMKADDFRFSLPRGTKATDLIITAGSFDTIKGSVKALKINENAMSAEEFSKWILSSLQNGGQVTASESEDESSIHIEFSYFGDQ